MRLAHHRTSLVGRGPELGEVVQSVRRGGQLAVVEGEAGIGKTSLIEATLDVARETGARCR